MEILKKPAELSAKIHNLKKSGKKIGFVPTMGYLHAGHVSLVNKAKAENDIIVVSIFVNPTQFGPGEDFERYPRNLASDAKLLEQAKTDFVFHPEVEDIYPKDKSLKKLKANKELTKLACGQSRPGHFDGVVTVVARLFDIVLPDQAYFGLKDYQQFLVIKKMTEDLKYNIKIIGCPIVREPDGLAMSSRNSYLTPLERKAALVLYQSLILAKKLSKTSIPELREKLIENISQNKLAKLDYLEIVDRENLQRAKSYQPEKLIILLAVFIGKTRLIDNMFI